VFPLSLFAIARGEKEAFTLHSNKLKHMTKNEELKAWQEFAESLPIESYSKGAMQSLLIELENALRSDWSPTLSLFDASQQASSWIDGAKNTAENILKHAKQDADKLSAEAKDEERRFRARVDAWKTKAVKEVESL
jgi:cell division septum initiation protein DivIVA